MITSVVQRWRDRRESYRPAGEPIATDLSPKLKEQRRGREYARDRMSDFLSDAAAPTVGFYEGVAAELIEHARSIGGSLVNTLSDDEMAKRRARALRRVQSLREDCDVLADAADVGVHKVDLRGIAARLAQIHALLEEREVRL